MRKLTILNIKNAIQNFKMFELKLCLEHWIFFLEFFIHVEPLLGRGWIVYTIFTGSQEAFKLVLKEQNYNYT